ncbi:MAG: family NAD(P)-dependent oxidoreductase [Nocardioides sp.]|jgi:hypothetical protein|nr:family NAD(P)-dependent oxidoreductase [Nocardioides sp.]
MPCMGRASGSSRPPGPVRCRTTGTRSSSRRGSLETAPLLARLRKLAAPLERRTFVSPAEGARTTVFCATSPEAVPGGYHRRSAAAESSDDVRDASVAARLWDATSAWAESV